MAKGKAVVKGKIVGECPECGYKIALVDVSEIKPGETFSAEEQTVKCDGMFCSAEIVVPKLGVKIFDAKQA